MRSSDLLLIFGKRQFQLMVFSAKVLSRILGSISDYNHAYHFPERNAAPDSQRQTLKGICREQKFIAAINSLH